MNTIGRIERGERRLRPDTLRAILAGMVSASGVDLDVDALVGELVSLGGEAIAPDPRDLELAAQRRARRRRRYARPAQREARRFLWSSRAEWRAVELTVRRENLAHVRALEKLIRKAERAGGAVEIPASLHAFVVGEPETFVFEREFRPRGGAPVRFVGAIERRPRPAGKDTGNG